VDFLAAKLLGSYELELHRVVESALSSEGRDVVVVGSGEGYYAVGFAKRIGSGARVHAFELSRKDRELCDELAAVNGVEARMTQLGSCDVQSLAEVLLPRSFLLCDCEGCEHQLLRPDAVPSLATATILVELHPHVHPDIEVILRGRFAGTHEVEAIPQLERRRDEWPELRACPEDDAYLLLSEGWLDEESWRSSGRSWLYLTPA